MEAQSVLFQKVRKDLIKQMILELVLEVTVEKKGFQTEDTEQKHSWLIRRAVSNSVWLDDQNPLGMEEKSREAERVFSAREDSVFYQIPKLMFVRESLMELLKPSLASVSS